MGCWTINLSMSKDAPAMKAWREGKLQQSEPPTEGIPLMEQDPETGDWKALDLAQYGPSGIVEILEKADLWSGRGEHGSLPELVQKVVEGNRANRKKHRDRMRDYIRDRAADLRRSRLKIPFLSVGKDISEDSE